MKTKVLLDLDGVLADFYKQWYAYNLKWERKHPQGEFYLHKLHVGLTWEESCRCLTATFWETLPWMPDGKEILTLLESRFGQENIFLCTSNQVDSAGVAAYGKVQWI